MCASLFVKLSSTGPAGRVGTADGVAAVITFPLTADFLTGVTLPGVAARFSCDWLQHHPPIAT